MGQFDQSVDEDGVNLTPVPELDPTAAALDPAAAMIPPALLQGPMPTLAPMAAPVPMPTPPQAPAPPGQAQKLISLALLGLAAGLGPRHAGGGIARGVMAGQDANEADRRQQFKDQQAQYVQQQNEAVRLQGLADAQAKAAAVEYEKRMVKRQQILASVAKAVPSFTTKEDYDKFMDYAGNMAVQSGFRDLSPLALRSNFTFVAPSQKQVIAKQVEAALKRGKDLGQDPEQILQGSLYVDMVGDGKPTSFATKPMSELMPLAGMDVVRIEGKPVGTKPKGGDSTFDQTLAAKVAMYRADHPGVKEIPPKVMDQLVTEARTPARDPLAEELARQRLADLKNKAAGAKPIVEGTPEYRLAKDVAFGKYTMGQLKGMFSGREANGKEMYRATLDKAEEINPDFNGALFEQGYKFATSQQGQMAVVALNRVEPNIDKLIELSDKWDRTRFPTLNAFLRSGGFQLGGRTISDFGQLQTIVGDELGPALGVGAATDLKTKIGLELAGGNKGPDNFRSSMLLVKDALLNQRRAVTGRMGPYAGNDAPPKDDPAAAARAILDGRKR